MITTDTHNIAEACRAGLQMYRSMATQTGRTERMLRNLQPYDIVVVSNEQGAKRMRARLGPLQHTIDVLAIDPTAPDPLGSMVGYRGRGRAYFDHTWIEQFFAHQIDLMVEDMVAFEDRLSKARP